jgi:hypothetical protein
MPTCASTAVIDGLRNALKRLNPVSRNDEAEDELHLASACVEEVRKELPTAVPAYIVLGFTNSKEIVTLSHDRDRDGKYKFDRVDVEGSEPTIVAKTKDALLREFSK